MRRRLSDALVAVYERAVRSGALDRPRARLAFESTYLLYKRLLETGPVDGLAELVEPGSTVIDVGANIGFFSMRFGRWVGSTGRVIAIEPESRNFDSLQRRVARAGLASTVDCVQAVAADRPGRLHLALTPGHPGDHHIAAVGQPIQSVSLDALAAVDRRTVSLIKVDVQGAEAMVLKGAHRTIEIHRPAIFIEVDAEALERFGSSPRELIDLIVGMGYLPHHLTRAGPGTAEAIEDILLRSAAGYIDVLMLPT
jgi:FkbM family methyltransferase